ncbi:hypothetical protein ACFPFV_06390 [Salinicoccus siamensis]|uniref:hypothetical protein n=1 Tax=Salinicoccus siamensis TaxID=381830 RepID=UPI0036078F18
MAWNPRLKPSVGTTGAKASPSIISMPIPMRPILELRWPDQDVTIRPDRQLIFRILFDYRGDIRHNFSVQRIQKEKEGHY